jgi:hypothetical protein
MQRSASFRGMFASSPGVLLEGLFESSSEDNRLHDVAAGPRFDETWANADLSPSSGERRPTQPNVREGNPDHRHWEVLCSRLLSVSEEAVSDEDLLALLLSYLKSGVNSRHVAMQLITRFETFGSVVSARSEQINGAAEVEPDIISFLKVVRAAGTRLAREEVSGASGSRRLGQTRELPAHGNGAPDGRAVPCAVSRPPQRADRG